MGLAVTTDSKTKLSILTHYRGDVFTSQSCVVNPLLDLCSVHQHSKGVSEEQLARARLEPPPVILDDCNTILRSTDRHITKK